MERVLSFLYLREHSEDGHIIQYQPISAFAICDHESDSSVSDTTPVPSSQHASVDAKSVNMGRAPCSRKGLSWSDEEIDLLVKLREEENIPWSELTEQFGQKFPGRSQGSLQVYWSTKLGKRPSSPVRNI